MKGPTPTGLCWHQARRPIWTLVGSFGSPEKGFVSLKHGHTEEEGEENLAPACD